MKLSTNPSPVIGASTNAFIVNANDIDLGTLVNADVLYNNKNIGKTNANITYSFKLVMIKHETTEYDSNNKPHKHFEYELGYPL